MNQIVEDTRIRFKAGDDIRDAGLKTPEDVERVDDICYGSDPKWQILDVYRPKKCKGQKLPVIISYHGGAWVYGDKERYQYYCMSLAQRGFAVVNYTYRLAPEFQYPAPLEDANLVVTWVLDHAEEFDLDTENIFMVGDSAGAQGLALYAAICTNPDYAKEYAFTVSQHFVPKAIALNCGKAYVKIKDEESKGLMEAYLPEHGSERELELMSPVLHITENFPPTFVMTAEGDFLRDEAPVLAARLTECNVPLEYRFYKSEEQILGHVFHCNMKWKMAAKCNDDECAFFRSFM